LSTFLFAVAVTIQPAGAVKVAPPVVVIWVSAGNGSAARAGTA
jgi:hypothetical protein